MLEKIFNLRDYQKILTLETESISFSLVSLPQLFDCYSENEIFTLLDTISSALKPGGLFFIHGLPEILAKVGIQLDRRLTFKYWIGIESEIRKLHSGYPTTHAGLLMFVKGKTFEINKVRLPHQICSSCRRTRKDWGGKSHLMNPEGTALSDVWIDLGNSNNYDEISTNVIQIIEKLVPDVMVDDGVIFPKEAIYFEPRINEPVRQPYLPIFNQNLNIYHDDETKLDPQLVNVVHLGDAVSILRKYPDNSIDLVFADPPYNLDKGYSAYDDQRKRDEYLSWCNDWLTEYSRILKPNGSLYVLNLPHWSLYHFDILQKHLFFQNWIIWNALSEPRGKLLPAHYSLLFFTKHPTDFVFNYPQPIDAHEYCLRSNCVRQRKFLGVNKKEIVTDIWSNLHRIKHRKDRDFHPCQLPDSLLERIIQVSSNPGGIVLDALAGTGTTAVMASKLGRKFVAIDIDENYVQIMRNKLDQIQQNGQIIRSSTRKSKSKYSKKELQLELQRLAAQLGRLPTQEDVRRLSNYDLQIFLDTFPTWGKALKAAKLEMINGVT